MLFIVREWHGFPKPVWVTGMGMGRDSPTHKLQYLTVLDEQRLVLKGIPMGSWVKPATGTGTGKMLNTHGFTHAIPYSLSSRNNTAFFK